MGEVIQMTQRREFNPKTDGQLLATPKAKDLVDTNVIEPKYDGHRVYLHIHADGTVVSWARGGTNKTGLIPEIEAVAGELGSQFGELWLDGEVVDLTSGGFAGEEGADNWGTVQSVLGSKKRNPNSAKVTFMTFDLMMFNGLDVRDRTLRDRREMLEVVAKAVSDKNKICITPQFPYDEVTYQVFLDKGFEGGVVKNPESKYVGKRGYGWYRLKRTETIDVVITGIIPGRGKFEGLLGAVVFGAYTDDGKLVNLGQCSGMIDRVRAEMTRQHELGLLKGTVIEVVHFGQSPQGGYRHPQFKRVRTDKAPEACLLSDVSAVPPNYNKVVS